MQCGCAIHELRHAEGCGLPQDIALPSTADAFAGAELVRHTLCRSVPGKPGTYGFSPRSGPAACIR
jgi:hypothetical protein